jgi:hypothetical protein
MTAFMGGVNKLFSAVKRKGRGHRAAENMTAMLYFVAEITPYFATETLKVAKTKVLQIGQYSRFTWLSVELLGVESNTAIGRNATNNSPFCSRDLIAPTKR